MDPLLVAAGVVALTVTVCTLALITAVVALLRVFVEHQPEEPTSPPVKFHSRYCANRYGSPCNCKGPQP